MSKDGQLTAAAAKSITDEMNRKGYDVYYDHGKPSNPNVGKIVSSIVKEYRRGDELGQLDIAIVKKDTNDIIVLIEIEETNDRPKTLLSDVFGTLTGNFISLPGKDESTVGDLTTLIIIGKGEKHRDRNEHIREKAMMAKSALGTGNSQIGNIVIKSFSNDEKLEIVLMKQIDEAIRRNA